MFWKGWVATFTWHQWYCDALWAALFQMLVQISKAIKENIIQIFPQICLCLLLGNRITVYPSEMCSDYLEHYKLMYCHISNPFKKCSSTGKLAERSKSEVWFSPQRRDYSICFESASNGQDSYCRYKRGWSIGSNERTNASYIMDVWLSKQIV